MLKPIQLQQHYANPFRDGIVGDAWDGKADQDVTSIHNKEFEECLKAMDYVLKTDNNAGLIIYGAAGSGKTHLVRRLRKRLTAHFVAPRLDQLQQIFAYVRLDTSARMLARHIRNRVASDLLRVPEGASVSQFELMVVAGLMMLRDGEGDVLTWWEYYREERATEMEEAIEKLGERCQLSANFVRVLSHLVQKRHRLDVAAWLRGESLPQHSYDRLGVGIPSDDDPEQEALAVYEISPVSQATIFRWFFALIKSKQCN